MPYKRRDEVTLWCSAGNSHDELMKHPGKSLALVPCTAAACPRWEDGRCPHLERVGRQGRLPTPY